MKAGCYCAAQRMPSAILWVGLEYQSRWSRLQHEACHPTPPASATSPERAIFRRLFGGTMSFSNKYPILSDLEGASPTETIPAPISRMPKKIMEVGASSKKARPVTGSCRKFVCGRFPRLVDTVQSLLRRMSTELHGNKTVPGIGFQMGWRLLCAAKLCSEEHMLWQNVAGGNRVRRLHTESTRCVKNRAIASTHGHSS